MTYCVGFKSKTAVFLISDSLISGGYDKETREAFGTHTTFGELVDEEDNIMQDTRYKVFKLPNNVLATFAGDLEDSLEALAILRNELEQGLDPINAFKSVIASGPFTHIELLLGFMHQGEPKLYSYNRMDSGLFREEHSIIHIGSGQEHPYLTEKTSQFASFLVDNHGDEKSFIYMLAFLQNFAIKNPLISLGVGGFYYGGFVNLSGIRRMWNTTYLMYAVAPKNGNRNLFLNYQISLNRKDDLLLVSSSFLNHHRIYFQEIDSEDSPELPELQKRVNELKNDYWDGNFNFVILLNQLNYGFTICYMDNKDKLPEIEITTDRTKGETNYRLSLDLANYLLNPPTVKETDLEPEWDRSNPAHLEIPIRWFA
ncbi:hypothetical protein QT711_18805 [Sporosarcina saromensis]|uniref:Uncharacterized protein n=1 Tax=Sporosarcina saromensis TaxID=359365 RepID=A0ABU4GHX0_9BACL|nr:hypothetical protein [Sporosarcina saromensis]MDW0115207.1 hypothetical protein [Sporosarcina saromensis]